MPKTHINLWLDVDIVRMAKLKDINLSKTLDETLRRDLNVIGITDINKARIDLEIKMKELDLQKLTEQKKAIEELENAKKKQEEAIQMAKEKIEEKHQTTVEDKIASHIRQWPAWVRRGYFSTENKRNRAIQNLAKQIGIDEKEYRERVVKVCTKNGVL